MQNETTQEQAFARYPNKIQPLPDRRYVTIESMMLVRLRDHKAFPKSQGDWFRSAGPVSAGRYEVHFFRQSAGFSLGCLQGLLKDLGLELGRVEHLMALHNAGLDADRLPLAAFGSGCLIDCMNDWMGKIYPIVYGDRSVGTIEVDRKQFNRDDYHWIADAVTVFGVKQVA